MRTTLISILAETHHTRILVIHAAMSLSRVPAQRAPHSHFSEDNEPRIGAGRRECGSSSSVRSNEVLALPEQLIECASLEKRIPHVEGEFAPGVPEVYSTVEPALDMPYVKAALCKPVTSGSMSLVVSPA